MQEYSSGGRLGESGGSIVPGSLGGLGESKETKWMRGGSVFPIEVGEGGKGGRGVGGLHGGKGADGWVSRDSSDGSAIAASLHLFGTLE